MVKSYDGTVFAQGIVKSVGRNRHDINKLYTTVARRVLSVYERFLRRRAGTYDGCGLVVMDQRDPVKDVKLLSSLQSQLFSIEFDVRRIAETPLLVPSEWYHGVQAQIRSHALPAQYSERGTVQRTTMRGRLLIGWILF